MSQGVCSDTDLPSKLTELNKLACSKAKAGDHNEAIRIYSALCHRATTRGLTHSEIYVVYTNRSKSYLALGQFREALDDAIHAIGILKNLPNYLYHPAFSKALCRKGFGFLGLGLNREALHAFEEALIVRFW